MSTCKPFDNRLLLWLAVIQFHTQIVSCSSIYVNFTCPRNTTTFLLIPSLFPQISPYLYFNHEPTTSCNTFQHPSPQLQTTTKLIRVCLPVSDRLQFGPIKVTSKHQIRIFKDILNASCLGIARRDTGHWFGLLSKRGSASSRQASRQNSVLARAYGKQNMFYGTTSLGHKDSQWEHLKKLAMSNYSKPEDSKNSTVLLLHQSSEFQFVLPGFILPKEAEKFLTAWLYFNSTHGDPYWIKKPPTGSRSRGVQIINSPNHQFNSSYFVQKYVTQPYLVNGAKVELRLYVLVTSLHPLRLYVTYAGTSYIAGQPFNLNNTDEAVAHMKHDKFGLYIQTEQLLRENWNVRVVQEIKNRMEDAVVKSFISVEAKLWKLYSSRAYNSYNSFQILAFDFLIGESGSSIPLVWLNEVNSKPLYIEEASIPSQKPWNAQAWIIAGFQLPPTLSPLSRIIISKNLEDYYLKPDKRNPVVFNEALYKFPHKKLKDLKINLTRLGKFELNQLVIAADELHRCQKFGQLFTRIFPSPNMGKYLTYFTSNSTSRIYHVFNSWELRYGNSGGEKYRQGLDELRHQLNNAR